MRRSLFVFGLLAALPGLAQAQQPKLVNCRSLEAAGNFVGPDEVIVDDMVCQKAKPGADAAKAQPQPLKPVIGTTISDTPEDNVVEAAKAAGKRIAARKEMNEAEARKQAAEAAASEAPVAPVAAPSGETPSPAQAPANVVEVAPVAPARPAARVAEPVAAPPTNATPAVAAVPSATPVSAPAAENPEPPSSANSTAPAPSPKSETAATPAPSPASEPAARPAAATNGAPPSEPDEVVIQSAPAAAPAATLPATERNTNPPAEAAAAATAATQPAAAPAAEPAPAVAASEATAPPPHPAEAEPPVDPSRPATSGGFYDANAPKRSANTAPQANSGFASAEQVNAGLAPGATSIPPASQPAAAEAPAAPPAAEAEPQHTTIAASRVAFDDPERDRSVKLGDFAKPTEVSSDPNAEHRTSVDPSDADGFQDRQRPECTKNITLGGLNGERLVLGVPTWAAKWIEKNEKRMPEMCFSETPMKTARNYLIMFSTSAGGPASNKEAADAVLSPGKGSSAAGVGTFTTSYGSTWHYSYDRNVGTTVLTQDDADEPHGQAGQVLYATAYTEEGVPVSQRWPGQLKKEIKQGEKSRKKLKSENEALEHVSDDLLNQMVEDIQKF